MDQSHSESHHHVNYFLVFMALCVCTGLSVAFDVIEMSPTLLVIAVLAVAVAKASFVMTYFMHLKFEGRWKFIVLMPTAILSIGLMIALAPDMAMHYYDYNVAQSHLTAEHNEEGYVKGHGSHAEEGKKEGKDEEHSKTESKHH